MLWASAMGSMWPAGWIRWSEMNTLWATGALFAAILLLAILLPQERDAPHRGFFPRRILCRTSRFQWSTNTELKEELPCRI